MNNGAHATKRRVSLALGLGVFFISPIFVWFLIGKGYSLLARFLGFAWLVVSIFAVSWLVMSWLVFVYFFGLASSVISATVDLATFATSPDVVPYSAPAPAPAPAERFKLDPPPWLPGKTGTGL